MLTDDVRALMHSTYSESCDPNHLMRDKEMVGAYFGPDRFKEVRKRYLAATGQDEDEEKEELAEAAPHEPPHFMQIDDFEPI